MVEYLEFFGRKWPVRIGYYVMKKIKEETGKDFQTALAEANANMNLEMFESILWYALEMGAKATGEMEQFQELERDQMEVALDLCFPEFVETLSSDTFFPKEMQDKVANGQASLDDKKKTEKKKPAKKKKQKA